MLTSRPSSPPRQQGLSLIELMIALTLGLLVIGAVSGVFLTTSRNYTQDELLSRMQENARYAMHVLAEDLSMGGYWGPLITGDNINVDPRDCTSSSADLNNNGTPDNDEAICQGLFANSQLSISTDCGPGLASESPWVNWINDPFEFRKVVTSGTDAKTVHSCIDDSGFQGGSDVLVIKRVEGQELDSTRDDTASAVQGDLFVRTDGNEAMLFEYYHGLDVSEDADTSDWRYRSDIYYIQNYFIAGDGVPTLVRQRLDGDGFDADAQEVAQGIERFRVLFGIDTDGDATANFYSSSPTLNELEDITNARIYVLARSMSEDPAYENDKTYQLGDLTVDYSGAPDSFYRRVFSTTVTLRNQRNRITAQGGT